MDSRCEWPDIAHTVEKCSLGRTKLLRITIYIDKHSILNVRTVEVTIWQTLSSAQIFFSHTNKWLESRNTFCVCLWHHPVFQYCCAIVVCAVVSFSIWQWRSWHWPSTRLLPWPASEWMRRRHTKQTSSTRHDAQRGTTNNVERNEHWLLHIGSDVVYKSGCVLSCDNICSGLSADLRPRRVFHFPLFFHYNIQIQRKPKIDIFDTADTRVLTLSFCLSLVPVQCSIIPATEQS